MRTVFAFIISCLPVLGQNLFPPPGSPLMLDSTKLVPAITNSGGGAQVWTNDLGGFLFPSSLSSAGPITIRTNDGSIWIGDQQNAQFQTNDNSASTFSFLNNSDITHKKESFFDFGNVPSITAGLSHMTGYTFFDTNSAETEIELVSALSEPGPAGLIDIDTYDDGTTNSYSHIKINSPSSDIRPLITLGADNGGSKLTIATLFTTPTNSPAVGQILQATSAVGDSAWSGFLIKSNTIASIPILSKGDVFLWSSNGVLFSINSNQAGTLTTNRLSPP